MEGSCLIISGGDYSELPDSLLRVRYVIACDRGWQYAQKMNIEPDLIVGDFDSAPQPDSGVPIDAVPTRKDSITDTMLAIRHALDLGYRGRSRCAVPLRRPPGSHLYKEHEQTGAFIAAPQRTCTPHRERYRNVYL